MRLLFIIGLMYLGYRLFKSWVLPETPLKRTEGEGDLTPVDDVMIKDPLCGAYFPRQKGIKGVVDGKAYYFCSTECRDKFLESASNDK
jgi:YHS domain-containing protein